MVPYTKKRNQILWDYWKSMGKKMSGNIGDAIKYAEACNFPKNILPVIHFIFKEKRDIEKQITEIKINITISTVSK